MTNIVLPFPDLPQNGGDFDADVVRENIEALAAYMTAIPGNNIIAASILEAALDPNINPRLRSAESEANFVVSGGLPGGFSTLTLTVPSGIAHTTGYRHAITSQIFTLSINKDTYFSVNKNGAIDTPQAVANGAAIPALPTDSQWLFKAPTNGTAIASIVDMRVLHPVTPAVISNPYKFMAYRSAAFGLTFASGVPQRISCETELYDTSFSYDNATNFRFVAPVAGFYRFNGAVGLTEGAGNTGFIWLYKNGAQHIAGAIHGNYAGAVRNMSHVIAPPPIQLAAGDYIEMWFATDFNGTVGFNVGAAPLVTYFGGELVSVL